MTVVGAGGAVKIGGMDNWIMCHIRFQAMANIVPAGLSHSKVMRCSILSG